MRVVIVGTGIGGLAAAAALRTIGAETLVIERADSIRRGRRRTFYLVELTRR